MPTTKTKNPSGIGGKLRTQLDALGMLYKDIAAQLGVRPIMINEMCREYCALSPQVAARLHRVGIDGRVLFMEQASNRLARYEEKERLIQEKNK